MLFGGKMVRKIKSIYEYFQNYTEEEIDSLIRELSPEEKALIIARYGEDLHNPMGNGSFTRDKSHKFYSALVPKMKRLLAERKVKDLEKIISRNADLELKKRLLELIKSGNNNNEICTILSITPQQLYSILLDLKNNGMTIFRKYYSDGSIKYRKAHSFPELRKATRLEQDKAIITNPKENNLKILIISDLHFGNELERLDLIDRAYDYCINNGIHIILSGGDLIDGSFSNGNQKISDLYEQIEFFLKNYPYDKSILTFSVAGDHDLSAFRSDSLNIIEACNNFRHDIVFGGYNNTGINVKNDQILLYHHINNGAMRDTGAPIILHGHHHKYKTSMKGNLLDVTIPSLSNINQPMPSVLELDLDFYKGYISNAVIKQVYFGNQDIILGESSFDLLSNREVTYEAIRNIETYKVPESVSDENRQHVKREPKQLSQTEKFYRRYGRR